MIGTILIVLGILVILGLVGFIFYLSKDEVDPQDLTIANNYMKQFTNGHFEGTVVFRREYSKRTRIDFMPKDVDLLKYNIFGEKFVNKPIKIWVQNEKIINYPRGSQSDHRNYIDILPPRAEDIAESLKKTPKGKAMMEKIEKINEDKLESEVLRNAFESVKHMYKDNNLGEITIDRIKKIQDLSDTEKEIFMSSLKKNNTDKGSNLGLNTGGN